MNRYQADLRAWAAKVKGLEDAIKKTASGASRIKRSVEELQNDLRVHEAKKPLKPRVPRLIRGDETSEHLAWSLAMEWPSAAIISSEAGVVFGGHAMGPETVMRTLALQNTLWDGGDHQVGRRTSESFIVRGCRLTISLQVQDEPLRLFCEKNGPLARGMGYFARFLFSQPQSIQGQRLITEEPPQALPAKAAFDGKLATLLNMPLAMDECGALTPACMKLTPEGKKAWRELYNGIERELRTDGELCDIRDVASKAADNIARLAAIFHVFQHGLTGNIDASDINRAGEIVVWHLNEARRFLGEFSMPPELAGAARLESWVIERCRQKGTAIVLRRDVQQFGPNSLRGKKPLDDAIKELQELSRASGVRREIHLNPALLGGGAQ
jgi:putative DNA primase/helicase